MDTVRETEDPVTTFSNLIYSSFFLVNCHFFQLPAPPTFSDPPGIARISVATNNPIKGFVVGQQLLRVNAPPSGNQAGIRELESSVSDLYLYV